MDAKRIIAVIAVVVVGSLMLRGKDIDMNVQRFVVIVVVAVVASVVLSGCVNRQDAVAGIVAEPTQLTIGRPIRNFPVVTADGQQTSFGELREPIAIVTFVSSSGPQCCWLNPELISLAEDLRNKSVTVAQISEPTEKCPHGPECVAACNLRDSHLISLCDADRIAWNAYRKPKPNTVIMVNSRGNVVAIGSLANLETVVDKAYRLADEVEAFEESAYEN